MREEFFEKLRVLRQSQGVDRHLLIAVAQHPIRHMGLANLKEEKKREWWKAFIARFMAEFVAVYHGAA